MFCQPLLLACKRQGNVDMLESFLWQICLSAAVSAGTATSVDEKVWHCRRFSLQFPCRFQNSKLAWKGTETLKAMTSWLAIFGCGHINLTKNLAQVEQRQPSKQCFASFAVVALSKQVLPRIQSHRPLQKTIIKFGTSSNLGCSYVSRSCIQDHRPERSVTRKQSSSLAPAIILEIATWFTKLSPISLPCCKSWPHGFKLQQLQAAAWSCYC